MPEPIRQLNLIQFVQLLEVAQLSRAIVSVHLHHTWRPRHRDFRGRTTIEAMRSFHMNTNKWSDIAQHLTIDPAGSLWTGRNWNLPPASSSGRNGTTASGPFMIEMVGDFDEGQDPFEGAQRSAAVQVVAHLLRRFELKPSADTIKFHRQLGSPKTCPGTSIDYDALVKEIADVKLGSPRAAKPRAVPSPFAAEHRVGFGVSRGMDAADLAGFRQASSDEVPEDEAAARDIESFAHAEARRRTLPRTTDVFARADDDHAWDDLKRHAISLSKGELSEGGAFSTTPADLDAIVEGIRAHVASGDTPNVVLYAHGGLVGEKTALDYASRVKDWWLEYGVYPVFFIWETQLLEILRQFVIGPRDIWDWTTDPAIEVVVKGPGSLVWGGMKESARRASAEDASDGNPGGALQFAKRLATLVAQVPSIKVHAVGHSAGSIFHAHLLPALAASGVKTSTLAFLAPAIRTDLFTQKLLPLVQNRTIGKLAMFTMSEDAERVDDCFGAYHKSLLYLVSRACEGLKRRPILGLMESVEKDPALSALFGLGGAAATAELQLSPPLGDEPNPLTAALRHGDFDNDPKSMSSALRRILVEPDASHLGEDDFPFQLQPRLLDIDGFRTPAAVAASPASAADAVADAPPATLTGAGRRRLALCVGIDAYPQNQLAGCVQDARLWSQTLGSVGFEVRTLFDAQATRQALVDGLERLVGNSRAGDVLVFQYSGHGTQMPDDDGDEVDRFDEAFVPVDYARGRFLLDDDVAAILSKLPSGVILTLFMDCCHSGTNSRFAPLVRGMSTRDERVRYLPPSAELVDAHRAFRRVVTTARASKPEGSLPGVIHFAACQDNEYAWESQGQGDFTGVAAPLLAKAFARNQTNEMFLAEVQAAVARKKRQHPSMMELPVNLVNRPVLSGLTAGG